jgi:hypothetical protein
MDRGNAGAVPAAADSAGGDTNALASEAPIICRRFNIVNFLNLNIQDVRSKILFPTTTSGWATAFPV